MDEKLPTRLAPLPWYVFAGVFFCVAIAAEVTGTFQTFRSKLGLAVLLAFFLLAIAYGLQLWKNRQNT